MLGFEPRPPVLNIHQKDWRWSWSSSTLATWCEEMTHWKRPWCWVRLRTGREGGDRGWDGQMASLRLTQWTWFWAKSRRWWRTGRPGRLQPMGSQRFRHDLVTEHHHHLPSEPVLSGSPACCLLSAISLELVVWCYFEKSSLERRKINKKKAFWWVNVSEVMACSGVNGGAPKDICTFWKLWMCPYWQKKERNLWRCN